MRQEIGVNVRGTVPTKIIVNGTELDNAVVNGTDVITTYLKISLNIDFEIGCYGSVTEGTPSTCQSQGDPDDTEVDVVYIKTSWTSSGDKTISSISIAPVVELKDTYDRATCTTYGTRISVSNNQTIYPARSNYNGSNAYTRIDFRCQLKQQTLIINFTDGSSVSYTLPDFSAQTYRITGSGDWSGSHNFHFSKSVDIEWVA